MTASVIKSGKNINTTKASQAFCFLMGLMAVTTSFAKTHFVDQRVSNTAISIIDVQPIRIVENQFNTQKLLEARVRLEMSGTIEGNLCSNNSVALQNTLLDGTDPQSQIYEMELKGAATGTGILSLEDPACPEFSRPEPFRVVLELTNQFWDSSWQQRHWQYRIQDQFGRLRKLEIYLNATHGWTVQFN